MKKTLFALAATGLFLAQSQPACAAESDEGFKTIFNGKNLSGWDGNPKFWSVRDGAIVGQTTADNPTKGNTFLIWTNGTTADFELRFSYRIIGGNSGMQYRSKVVDPQNWVVGGYQADFEAGTRYSGILYDEAGVAGKRQIMADRGEKVVWNKDCQKQVTGSVGKSDEIQAAIKHEDWNEFVIIAKGTRLQHFINGKLTVDVTDECESKRLTSGVLALQLHAGPPMAIHVKNVRLKSLGAANASSEAIQKLQGAWRVSAGEANGMKINPEDVEHVVLTIEGTSYTVATYDRKERGTFELDLSTEPRRMDVRPKTGSDTGRTLLAIFDPGDETFRLCYNLVTGQRPSAFATTEGSGLLLLTFARKNSGN
jgi:uncharacterized protein (TIGR03067 family)